MKRTILNLVAVISAMAAGYVAHEHQAAVQLLPEREQPKATAVVIKGPTEAVAGTDSFFVAEVSGDHGRPTWIVSPECDLSVSDDGTVARMKCNEPGAYTITVTVGGKDATVAADLRHLTVIDVDKEIDQAVAAATAINPPHEPTLAERVLELESLPEAAKWAEAAGVFRLMSQRLQAGLVPSDANPLALAQGQLGEDWRPFVADLEGVVNEMRLSGEVTTAASFAPVFDQVAVALGARP